MKKEFLEPSVEVLKFHCENGIEGSPDTTTPGSGTGTDVDDENIFD